MAMLKAARAMEVPSARPEPDLDGGLAAASSSCIGGTTTAAPEEGRRLSPLVVIGHRGKGMNALAASADPRLRGDVRENTLRAFNDAADSHPAVAYVEFAGGLQGIVSEVRAILRQPSAVAMIKEGNKLSLMTYGQLNNVPEVVYVQHMIGVDGVIVDLVREIADAVSAFTATTAVQASACQSQDSGGGDTSPRGRCPSS